MVVVIEVNSRLVLVRYLPFHSILDTIFFEILYSIDASKAVPTHETNEQ